MKSKIILAIKRKIDLLGITQKEFGKMFGVKKSAVSLWLGGDREAPYRVLEFVLEDNLPPYEYCPTCKGSGIVDKSKVMECSN